VTSRNSLLGLIRCGRAAAFAGAMLVAGLLAATWGEARAATLTPADKANVERALGYLNRIGTLRARFVQISSNGAYAEGQVLLERPGKMRFDYDPPVPALLIANGLSLLYFDRELKEASFLPLWETPLWFLLREEVKLSDDMHVEKVEQARGALRVSLRDASNPDIGEVTLVFQDEPLALRKWQIVDAQGVTTEVSLVNPEFGVAIAAGSFEHSNLGIANPGTRKQDR
jgi:outer membrane lipoprotein-sorting protein